MRFMCTKEDMGGSFKCIHFGSIYQNGGTCSKQGECDSKQPHPIDVLKEELRK